MDPRWMIEQYGEVFDIYREGAVVSQAKGAKDNSKGRRQVMFPAGTAVEAGDLLVSTVSGDQCRVTEVECQTHHGAVILVQAFYSPEKQHMKPQAPRVSNVVNVGTMNQSAIQQGSEGAIQSMTVGLTPEERLTVDEIIKAILEAAATLEDQDKAEVTAQVATVQAQLKTSNPQPSVIKSCLGAVKVVFARAVTAAAVGVATAAAEAATHVWTPVIDKIKAYLAG